MSKLTNISRSDCDPIRKDLNEAIASVLAKYGLKGGFRNATYDHNSLSFNKVEFNIEGSLSRKEQTELDNLKLFMRTKLDKSETEIDALLDRTFIVEGMKIKFIGFSYRSPKRPLKFRDINTGQAYSSCESLLRKTLHNYIAA